jgi:class 3 adenylate cyclase
MDLGDWLRSLGLGKYEAAFRENDIDDAILPSLTAEDLKDLGVSIVGHRRKLLDAIAGLRADASLKARPPGPLPPIGRSAKDAAERRQLTVMFCDLVGSTALSVRLDPEDMREIIGAYHRCCAEQITRAGGFVAKYMGDGVLAYFGYPQAHEDDAERAVRSGLSLIEAMPQLRTEHDVALQVRVGIATGVVVVGDLIGEGAAQEQGVVGETPNLAARLQAIAEPGQVVISQSTRRITGGTFEYRDLGNVALKGFADLVQASQVTGASAAEGRFYAQHQSELTPLVGRGKELELLQCSWRDACEGEGRVVLVSGEPGIGKSRLTDAFQGQLAGESHHRVRYFCSPDYTSSALYPVIRQLERAAGFERRDPPVEKLAKLDGMLNRASDMAQEEIAVLADLLSLPTEGRYSLPKMSPRDLKEKTLAALLIHLESMARQLPLLLVYEDVHWIDPTTRELLEMMVERAAELRAMVVITFRPEFQPPWIDQAHVTSLSLARLGESDGLSLVGCVVGDQVLSPEIVAEIVERADGIPLFVEELTKAVLEGGGSTQEAKRTISIAPPPKLAVPSTLHGSLMARLDRLGTDAKEVAQIGAAIGREFSYELLALVAEKNDVELQSALDSFSAAGLILRRGVPPEPRFFFKHTLVRDAAYGTLLRGQRQQLHGRIAAVLERDFTELVKTQPEMLAHHCAEAGLVEHAIEYCIAAAQRATARSNNVEASEHLAKGLTLLEKLPASAKRTGELRYRIATGGWWMAKY